MLPLVHRVIEGNALIDKPIKMADRLVAIDSNFSLIRLRRIHHEVGEHVFHRVFHADSLLDPGTAAEVKMAGGHSRDAASSARLLKHQDVGPSGTCLDGSADSCTPETNDDNVGLIDPFRNFCGLDHLVLTLTHGFP
jgi:hypothetical protein